MSAAPGWPAVAFLDALRPESGWSVDTAFLATYSADIVSLVAALLALAGRDDDAGDGNPTDLADAVEQLRGKVWFVAQEGRFAFTRRTPAIAVLLDQFVKAVRSDEEHGSWHPKFAAVRFHTPQGKAWRVWVGSRNLTVASNLDFGLTLHGEEGAGVGSTIDGIDTVLARLCETAGLSRAMARRLSSACRQVRWNTPKGLRVREMRMLSPGARGPALPRFSGADEVVVISPFLDGTFVAAAAGWAKSSGAKRYLLSTQAELCELAHQAGQPLAPFKDHLLVLESPAREGTAPEPVVVDAEGGNGRSPLDEELIVQGLHAKLFAVRHGTTWQMWAGSANATSRAWDGSNYESVALLEGEAIVGTGLHALLGSCRVVTLETLLESPPVAEDEGEKTIECVRKRICACFEGHLVSNPDGFRLVSEAPFLPIPLPVRVEVGLMTGSLLDWEPGADSVFLGRFDVADQTGLVQWRLSAGEVECRWLQCLEVRPPLLQERDHAAIAARLTPTQFIAWIRSLLSGQPAGASGGESWQSTGSLTQPEPLTKITLEEVLGSRARKGSRMADLDARVDTYLEHVMLRCVDQPETLRQLNEFSDLWRVVRTELTRS